MGLSDINRLRISLALDVTTSVGCGYAGYRLWKKHPLAGTLVGVFVVAPAINTVQTAIVAPRARETITQLFQPVASRGPGITTENTSRNPPTAPSTPQSPASETVTSRETDGASDEWN